MKAWYCLAGLVAVSIAVAASSMLGGCRVDFGAVATDGDFLASGQTLSSFQALQIDPQSEDSAGPQFVVAEDLNNDGLIDLVSAWNQTQPVQIHLQQATANGIAFQTTTLAGSLPVIAVAGLAVTDFDGDGRMDIAVLVKETLLPGPECLDSELPAAGMAGMVVLYLGPDDPDTADQALAWTETPIGTSFLQGNGNSDGAPENGGFTAMALGDMNVDGNMDLVVAWNSDCGDGGTASVVIFTNGGPGDVRDGTWAAQSIPDPFPRGETIKSIALGDIDGDSDLDVVVTYPGAPTMNVRWYRNPLTATERPDDFHVTDGNWQTGFIAQIPTGADIVKIGDIDRDGIRDVVVRSTNGKLIQWLKGPGSSTVGSTATTAPIRSIPWQVYTLAEFVERTPDALALGDLNGDAQLEVIATAQGGLIWFDSQAAPTVYDQWIENLIIDDNPEVSSNNPTTTDPTVEPNDFTESGGTIINAILVVDIDQDGANDIVATLDRSGLSGVTNDALVWFRNTAGR